MRRTAESFAEKACVILKVIVVVLAISSSVLASSNGYSSSSERFFNVYSDKDSMSNHFYPTGWVGDWENVIFDDDFRLDPYEGRTCMKIVYSVEGSDAKGWAGIYWLHPADNWGDKPRGFNLTGVIKLIFWAKGAVGGERVEFKVGGVAGLYGDSLQPAVSTGVVNLTSRWERFSIDLLGRNMSRVVGGFCWISNRTSNPNGATFYLDHIRYEYGYVDGEVSITQPTNLQELKQGLEYTVTARVQNTANLPTSEFKVSLEFSPGITSVDENFKILVLEYDTADEVSFEIMPTGIGEQTITAILHCGDEKLAEQTVKVGVGEPSFADIVGRNIVTILVAAIFAIATVTVAIVLKKR